MQLTLHRIPLLRWIMLAMVTAGLLFYMQPATAMAKADIQMIPVNFTEIATQARPGVVNISTVKSVKGGGRVFEHFFGQPFGKRTPEGRTPEGRNPFDDFFGRPMPNDPNHDFKRRSLGSGFIIDSTGLIVTNNHVIEDADQIKVKLSDDTEYIATVVGRDPSTDLALIKIEPKQTLTPLQMGNSEELQVGQWVVAIGSPFGLEQTVTAGIVSAKGRVIGSGPYDNFIQTDASINPGNSGGPLLNLNGEVIGINTAIIASGQGIGFAVPTEVAQDVIAQLQNKGEVTRGWLGVGIQDLSDELAEYYGIEDGEGALVTQVYEENPADKGGIKVNDVIVSANGQSVQSSRDLTRIIAATPVGEKTSIGIVRNGKAKTVTVKLAKRDEEQIVAKRTLPEETTSDLGFNVEALSPEIAKQLGLAADEKGVIVSRVDSEGAAAKAGLSRGDLVKEINRQPIENSDDFNAVIKETKSGDTLQLLIKRSRGGYQVIKMKR